MAFKMFERTTLQLSMIMLSSLYVTHIHAQTPQSFITPASPAACVALESNADRLACYDSLFKVPEAEKMALVSERQAANQIAPAPTEVQTIKEKISHGVSNIFAVEGPKIDPNTSLLDKRWELAPESKLGT